jgi:hypothetical protein
MYLGSLIPHDTPIFNDSFYNLDTLTWYDSLTILGTLNVVG